MPKVTRDRNERYGGGGGGSSSGIGQPQDSFYGNQYASRYSKSNTDMFSGPFAVSTPLIKGAQLPTFNPTLSPMPSTPSGPPTSHLGIYNNFKPDYFRAPTAPSGYLLPPGDDPKRSGFFGSGNKSTKPNPEKDNMTELNRKFLMSCVESLKRDNATCLAPAICEYLLQTMNIINQIQTSTGLPHMNDLLHNIRKLVSRMNGKYFEVKAKQEAIKEDIKRKSGKTTVKPQIQSSLPIVASTAWTTGTNRKREREPTPQSTSPRIFSTFNGDSQAKDQASSIKRVREENTTPSNSPALPTCNGLLLQKDINMITPPPSSGLSFKKSQIPNNTPNPTPNTTPTKVTPIASPNVTPLSSKTNAPAQFNTGIGLHQLQSKGDINSIKASPQEIVKPKTFPSPIQWPSMGSRETKPKEAPVKNNFQWGNPEAATGSSPVFTSFPSMNVKIDPKGITSQDGLTGGWAAIKPPTTQVLPTTSNNDDEEDQEPPKHEFTRVVEADAVYSKKCKLFEKRDGSFKERGIGVLYINKIKTDKFQVVIRAENSLGTVLLNMHLNSGLPIQKNGKNNVMTVDPTGDGGKGTSVLIRVKTGEDVDELIEKLNEFKGKSS